MPAARIAQRQIGEVAGEQTRGGGTHYGSFSQRTEGVGLLVIQIGLPWWVAPALSIAGFAGSLELLLFATIAAAVTAAIHLSTGRRTLLSVGVGTLVYVALSNLF
ncbi:hypothetical protein [Mycolicibacterium brumae]|uniref:hypothetical protein n=1 Tax=Mycolicibacterium brumae TaxID=85968 RepID=UPI000B82CD0A|nr:hypothetical protein [Mycolicibacterium brumae]RWA19618.1 hypothetical protein MBRU_16805 [Mycolicibacterium brumae DSM 44177]